MITDDEKWHYLAVKSLSALFRGITSKHEGEFYCLNCFCSYRIENELKKYKKVCENRNHCYVEMPEVDNKESLPEKINTCHNNPGKSSATKINKHIPSGYSLLTYCSFDTAKNKFEYYRGKNCMSTKIISYEKKEMIPLTKKEEKMHYKRKSLSYM